MIRLLKLALVASALTMSRTWASEPPGDGMSVTDFLVDRSSLSGKIVSVTGSAFCMSMELCSIGNPDQPMTSATFNPTALTRAEKKKLLGCNPFISPCLATVTGEVAKDGLHALAALKISFAPSPEEAAAADPTLPPCDRASEDDITSMVNDAPLIQMVHARARSAEVHSRQDDQGHRFCSARVVFDNGREIDLPYYFKHVGGQVAVVANLLSAIQRQE